MAMPGYKTQGFTAENPSLDSIQCTDNKIVIPNSRRYACAINRLTPSYGPCFMTILDRNFNLSQRMTQELGRQIVCGVFDKSESLPTEAELCEKFGVSRSAVREAVKM